MILKNNAFFPQLLEPVEKNQMKIEHSLHAIIIFGVNCNIPNVFGLRKKNPIQ